MEKQKTWIDNQRIYFYFRKSSRAKRPNLKLKNGKIIVSVPEGFEVDPQNILEDNPEWVLKHWKKAEEFREEIPERVFEDGESFSVLGDEKTVKVEKRRSNKVEDDIRLAEHLVDQTSLKDQLEKALREYARNEFESKTEKYSNLVDEDFEKIFVRDQTTRWGSCSSNKNLNFNWRLVLGPEHVLEYVVVHELVHLEHSNHGREFWSRVEELYPQYKRSDDWLSENTAKLVFEKDQLQK